MQCQKPMGQNFGSDCISSWSLLLFYLTPDLMLSNKSITLWSRYQDNIFMVLIKQGIGLAVVFDKGTQPELRHNKSEIN